MFSSFIAKQFWSPYISCKNIRESQIGYGWKFTVCFTDTLFPGTFAVQISVGWSGNLKNRQKYYFFKNKNKMIHYK